ncbi:MAG: hypothetical protein HY225_00400 [Candidatus Vogelbacteria bacterium]|nr:hypothetical protein [Candidatus Vogelbacteria bacterium]
MVSTIGISEMATYVVFMALLSGVIMGYSVVHVLQLITIWPLIAFGLRFVESFVHLQFAGFSLLARCPILAGGLVLLGLVCHTWWSLLGKLFASFP